ncbi:MAG: carbamoyl phosphate synthase small subunit [Synergistaceae bacterium]|nr:carbamoyl phosphate synthase small subunit [Synergistaceae bacterium]
MAEAVYLVLSNGRIFEGRPFGASNESGEAVGEVVFTTGMTGYLETLTDPSYHGQIVVQTFPLIGNYGVIPDDFESVKAQPKGYVVRELCPKPSNFRSRGDLNAFLAESGITGISGVDTRALTRIIRESGTMNGVITGDPQNVDLEELKGFYIRDAVANVSAKEIAVFGASDYERTVVLWDFGAKENIIRSLAARGCRVIRAPHSLSAEEILSYEPDGVMLTNGPGDPSDNVGIVKELKKLMARRVPTLGICLGHQLLALAMGGTTEKLKYGHRGANQPVRDEKTGRVSITTQNHGYAVVPQSIDRNVAKVRYVNANDGTCEGIDYSAIPAFTVQFHPEAAAGPRDTSFLFDRFINMMDRGAGVNAA